jgi:predicted ATPase
MRAEDVFGFVNRVSDEIRDLEDMERDLDETLEEGSYGRRIAAGAIAGQRAALKRRYGENPDARSHGETFIELLQQRIVPNGLYLLDEPEAPLSPHRILTLISIIKDAMEKGCQFIIATHSPILMAVPGAEILLLSEGVVKPVEYTEVEHVRLTKMFLNDPDAFLRHL